MALSRLPVLLSVLAVLAVAAVTLIALALKPTSHPLGVGPNLASSSAPAGPGDERAGNPDSGAPATGSSGDTGQLIGSLGPGGASAPATGTGGPTGGANPGNGSGPAAAAPAQGPTARSASPAATTTSNTTSSSAAASSSSPPATPPSINISTNIAAVPANDASCASAQTGAACTNAAVTALNHARSVLGLPAYAVPANFTSMTVPQQVLILSNLDRALYGLQTIAGLNTTLNTAAQAGVTNHGDPIGVNIGSLAWTSWGSNWASGYPSALFAYYSWMYDDGLGSPNADCTASDSSGCWGHRLNTLHNFGANVQIALGVGFSSIAYTELYEGFPAAAVIAYS